MKQTTLDGDILEYHPSPAAEPPEDPIYKYAVFFYPECSDCLEMETVYIQDCGRDGVSAHNRARTAAMHQTPFDVARFRKVEKEEKTDRTVDNSDEWRIDDFDIL